VEIALIYRVFLARSIETRLREDNTITGDVRSGEAIPPRQDQSSTSTGGASAETGTRPQDQGQTNERSGPNGTASFQRALSPNVFIPTTVFARPVVVGFRTVRWRGTEEAQP